MHLTASPFNSAFTFPISTIPHPHHNLDTGLDPGVCGRGEVGRAMHFQDVHENLSALSDDLISII